MGACIVKVGEARRWVHFAVRVWVEGGTTSVYNTSLLLYSSRRHKEQGDDVEGEEGEGRGGSVLSEIAPCPVLPVLLRVWVRVIMCST